MTDIASAIQSLNKKGDVNHEFVVRGEPTTEAEYNSGVDFVSGSDANGTAIFSDTKPYTWSQVSAEKALLQTEYDSKEYQRKRAAEYPSYGDQMDYIYHNGIDAWKTDIIDPIKAKYPKDNS